MFGRRRRPILGAAVVVGASRAAARHEVQKQAAASAQSEFEIQQEVGLRRREEEEQERRMQLAVNEAITKAMPQNQAAQQSAPAEVPPTQQYYNPQPTMPVQTTVPAQLYTQPSSASPSIQSEQLMPAPYSEVPAHLSGSPLGEQSPKIAQGIGSPGPAAGPKTQYCSNCGFLCQVGDKFCRQCGAKQCYQERMVA